jgi:biopolymer transport protein ExbD
MAKRRRKAKRKGAMPTPLRLTSMMDILTVLLLFLLKSFVIEGEVITPVPGVDLPESSSETKPRGSVVVAIFDDAVMLDGQMVARVGDAADKGGLLIPLLAERLDATRAQELDIARRRGEDADYTPRIAIQGDRDIPFEILERVMYTCNQSGFGDISLAVIGAS